MGWFSTLTTLSSFLLYLSFSLFSSSFFNTFYSKECHYLFYTIITLQRKTNNMKWTISILKLMDAIKKKIFVLRENILSIILQLDFISSHGFLVLRWWKWIELICLITRRGIMFLEFFVPFKGYQNVYPIYFDPLWKSQDNYIFYYTFNVHYTFSYTSRDFNP